MRNVECLIVGAGVSGLSLATALKKQYLIIEKDKTVGGLCKSFYEGEFVWDYAGHFFHFRDANIKSIFDKKTNLSEIRTCLKNTNICIDGGSVEYPFQMNIHQLQRDKFIDCLFDLFHRDEKDVYNNFEEMLYGKFGKGITELFLKPYNEKLYACQLQELDVDAMGRFFPYADPIQIIDNMKLHNAASYNDVFNYPNKGAQYFIDILLSMLPKSNIKCNETLLKLDINNKLAYTDKEEYKYDFLINTIPLNRFRSLIMNSEILDHVSLSCNQVLVFNLGFDRGSLDKKTHWTYYPEKDINFYRVGYYNNILGSDKLSLYVEIGFKEDAEIDIGQQMKLTLENLRKVGIIDEHVLIAYNVLIINPGYVHISNDSIKYVSKIRKKLEEKDVYLLGRYGRWTYCSIEDCIKDALNLGIMINGMSIN